MSVTNVTCKIGDKTIKFETGKLALQAPGAVVATSGDTNVLVTTVANKLLERGLISSL
jgi:polyribonucleotide nucleotidyltransferase